MDNVSQPETAVQTAPSHLNAEPEPYARVGEDGVSFTGPRTRDLPADRISVVLFGKNAAALAQSPELQNALSISGRLWQPIPVASDQNWGAASTQLVHAIMDEHSLAIVALDRDAARLAEQLALKTFVPVIALCGDRALTSTNVPWIFRLPASTPPPAALALLRDAEARSGPNRARLRDLLASGAEIQGLAFLPNGEPNPR
jgi:hypothetical protein